MPEQGARLRSELREGFGLAAARASGRPAIGTWLKLDTSETVEIAALAGLDFVIIDLEHAMIGTQTLNAMLAVAHGNGIEALVRVADHTGSTARIVLDNGAAGIVVPNVDSAEQARAIVASHRFAPWGARGLSTSARAGAWGTAGVQEYMRSQNEDTSLFLQIESVVAVEAAASIGRVPGVDGLLVGPMDLAASSAAAGHEPARVRALLETLERTCADHDIYLGTAAGPGRQQAQDLVARGYQLLAMSTDSTMLRIAATALRDAASPAADAPTR